MSNMTLRGIDPDLEQGIRKNAEKENISMNQWVLRVLKKSTGLDRESPFRSHYDLDSLAGTWSKKDAEAFETVKKDFNKIDRDLWK